MYTRAYNGEEKKLSIPENYDGTAFLKSENELHTRPIIPNVSEPKYSSREAFCKVEENTEEISVFSSDSHGECSNEPGKKKFTLGNIFEGFTKDKGLFSSFKIGSEELLIIGVAMLLFFSKSGDRECALLLLLLLFIN